MRKESWESWEETFYESHHGTPKLSSSRSLSEGITFPPQVSLVINFYGNCHSAGKKLNKPTSLV